MRLSLFACLLLLCVTAQAEEDYFDYYDRIDPENPAAFVVEDGELLWRAPAGPKQVSLERCDLGLGEGVVIGAYAQLPRYFEDAGRVMDLDARLIHCMVTLQGRSLEEIEASPYASVGEAATELEALAAWVAALSADHPLAPPQSHPAEQAALALGEALFYYRAGPHDFSCATCHRQSGKRIRLQTLANLTTAEGAAEAYTSWPAYRLSQGLVRSMGWRMRDCARQQRLPELQPGSEASVALQVFMAASASGAGMTSPTIKR
jgi:sulfur-oxidizing protein SoxA